MAGQSMPHIKNKGKISALALKWQLSSTTWNPIIISEKRKNAGLVNAGENEGDLGLER